MENAYVSISTNYFESKEIKELIQIQYAIREAKWALSSNITQSWLVIYIPI